MIRARRLTAWRGVFVALAALLTSASASALPSFDELKGGHRPSDVSFVDRRGVPVQTLRVDTKERRLAWVPLTAMSPAVLHALVLSEDRNFHEHSGVDWGAVATSAWGNLWNTKTRGASTLTMQLAGLIDKDLARPVGGRSVAQKLDQALIATRLEKQWTKAQILEAYLNEVTWRGEIVGIDAMSQTLFGKYASGLDSQEAAIAVALVRGPNAAKAVVAQRACGVLTRQQLSCNGIEAITELALSRTGGMPLGEQLAPQWARQVAASFGNGARLPNRIPTSLDAAIQRNAVVTLRRHMSELMHRHVEDGAVVVLDNASGEVLAWVGSSGSFSDAAQVDGVLARRQPGSTLKPFAYGLAFEKRLITPASLLDDSPAQLSTSFGLYLPQNYDRDFKGWISARTALGASLNVPAVRVGAMLGPDALFERLNAFGLQLSESGGFHGYALVLGSADVTLLSLTNAYRTLANGGRFTPVRLRSDQAQKPSVKVADAAAVHLVTDILADNNARVRTFGLDSALASRGFAAVKTGTSKDLRDNWCVGFTDRYTVGVWVGNASGEPMQEVSGVSGAAPIWHAVVQHLHEGRVSKPPRPPKGVIEQEVRYEADREPARHEVFIAGTEQLRFTPSTQASKQQRFGIASPRTGSVFALDPDIPPASQQIVFEGEAGVWLLDGKRVGAGSSLRWSPQPGRHELVLRPVGGSQSHTVKFEVRGASLKSASR
ncbi:hypothetical protein BH09PSE5_BH09PSE5_50480 [soil metagenome]